MKDLKIAGAVRNFDYEVSVRAQVCRELGASDLTAEQHAHLQALLDRFYISFYFREEALQGDWDSLIKGSYLDKESCWHLRSMDTYKNWVALNFEQYSLEEVIVVFMAEISDKVFIKLKDVLDVYTTICRVFRRYETRKDWIEQFDLLIEHAENIKHLPGVQ